MSDYAHCWAPVSVTALAGTPPAAGLLEICTAAGCGVYSTRMIDAQERAALWESLPPDPAPPVNSKGFRL